MVCRQVYRPFEMNRMQARHDSHWMLTPQVPSIYTQTVLNVARRRGLDTDELIAIVGLDQALLADATGLVLPAVHMGLCNLVIERIGNDGGSFEIGLELPLTTHGSLGFALLCSATLREGMELAKRFWQLRERTADLQIFEHGDHIVLEISTTLGLPPVLRQAFLECVLTVVSRAVQLLLGEKEKIGELVLPGPEPAYYARYRDLLPPARYGMQAFQFRVPLDLLDKPLLFANKEVLQHAIAQCERECALLEQPNHDLLDSVRAALVLTHNGYPNQDVLADSLHMSLRTLRRKLQMSGTSYKLLLEGARLRDALLLLETTALSIQDIAERLGYLNPTNFARAFRQWTGRAPREYRTLRALE